MSVCVRTALLTDATAIAQVNVTAWRTAYVGLIPQVFLDGLSVEARAAQWERWMLAGGPERRMLVADDGEVVGFAASWPTPDEDLRPDAGELSVINVRPDHWSAGVGGALMTATVEALTAFGHPEAALWVITGNTNARGFYEHLGWTADGAERVLDVPGGSFEQVRYRRTL